MPLDHIDVADGPLRAHLGEVVRWRDRNVTRLQAMRLVETLDTGNWIEFTRIAQLPAVDVMAGPIQAAFEAATR